MERAETLTLRDWNASPGSDMITGAAVIAIIAVMLIPLPSAVLDVLIAFNVTAAVVLLLLSLFITEPLAFSVFPTLLLLLTLFRLALNVASTRLILLNGGSGVSAAGKVIEAFGQFVVGGNYVVGAVIFLVLIAIQYIVVNHGSVRISEVTARFTLDALPGKQMAIDADLNAGLIDDKEAKARRKRIGKEAEFYGAMDGAVRFTQRDAVASIIIVAINIIAGFLIGVVSLGMSLVDSLQTYTILTIGDGLVSAVPALLISVTGGMMTTRATAEANLGVEVSRQLFSDYKPLLLASVTLTGMALVPGLPFLPFFLLASATGLAAHFIRKSGLTPEVVEDEADAVEAPPEDTVKKIQQLMRLNPLGVELGYQLIHLVDGPGGDFISRVKSIRRNLAVDLGVIIPPVHITDNLQLGPRDYQIKLKGIRVASGELLPGNLLAINPGTATKEIEGIETKEPTFGLPAKWIGAEKREHAQLAGMTVVDPVTVLSTHLGEVIKQHLHELLTRQEVGQLIEHAREEYPKVVEEVVPKPLGLGDVQKVLQNLLRERVSIRDFITILEVLADYAPRTTNLTLLTEFVRQALGRAICEPYISEGQMQVLTLAEPLERSFQSGITVTEQDSFLNIDPAQANGIVESIKRTVERTVFDGYPIILAPSSIRFHLRRFLEEAIDSLVVVSFNEVPPDCRIVVLGEISR